MRNRLLLFVITVALLAAACGARAAESGRTKVVAAFYPLAWLAQQVGGPDVAVRNLTRPGAEPHDLELTPRQIIDTGESDLAFYIKGVQPAVDKAVAQHAKDHAFDAASVVATLPAPQDEENTSFLLRPTHPGRPPGEDPHLWLDPVRFATVATSLGRRLSAVDSENAGRYQARAAQVVARLNALDGEYRTGLRHCARKEIITGHSAFAYLTQRYGLRQVGITGLDPESEPSPKRVADLTALVRRTGATTVFTESLVSPKVAETLAREAGVRTEVLDPIEGVRPGSGEDYLSLMRRDLAALRTALGCS